MSGIVGPSEWCRLCGHEVGIHYDNGLVNGQITPGGATWRAINHASSGTKDIRLAGTGECKQSPDGLHHPLPPMDDTAALKEWLEKE